MGWTLILDNQYFWAALGVLSGLIARLSRGGLSRVEIIQMAGGAFISLLLGLKIAHYVGWDKEPVDIMITCAVVALTSDKLIGNWLEGGWKKALDLILSKAGYEKRDDG